MSAAQRSSAISVSSDMNEFSGLKMTMGKVRDGQNQIAIIFFVITNLSSSAELVYLGRRTVTRLKSQPIP